ncbi:MAG: helix-turn-helix domain-containing protein [Rhodobacteraceae bacterium]|nr:helix-turn-helix domain-containing protein [Paracoccaceae bacterium]
MPDNADGAGYSGAAQRGLVPRPTLTARLLADAHPVVVIEAWPGMGKTVALGVLAAEFGGRAVRSGAERPAAPEEGQILLWDPPPDAVGAVLPGGAGRTYLAIRPGTHVAGLSRALIYGHAARFGNADLAISAVDAPDRRLAGVIRQTGGWPVLARAGHSDEETLRAFLLEEVLAPLQPFELAGLRAALIAETSPKLGGARPTEPELPPLPRGPALRAKLLAAVEAEFTRRASAPAAREAVARVLMDTGQAVAAIRLLQAAGDHPAAMALFEREGGPYFIHIHGAEAFDLVLSGFAAPPTVSHPAYIAARCIQAAKVGETQAALHLLQQEFGPAIHQKAVIFDVTSPLPMIIRLVRFLLFIYEGTPLSEDDIAAAASIGAALPIDAHILRGSYQNVVLEWLTRTRRFAQARQTAVRAIHHYRKADIPLLEFYISLHISFNELMSGTAVAARKAVEDASAARARSGIDSPSDARILNLLFAIIEHEGGQSRRLLNFLDRDLDAFATGEIWPSLADVLLEHGAAVIAARDGLAAARGFLDRMRFMFAGSDEFSRWVTIREITLLQAAGRWQEAAEKLEAAGAVAAQQAPALAEDPGRFEISLAISQLRHGAYHQPRMGDLAAIPAALESNPFLTHHERQGLGIVSAWLYRRQGDISLARRSLAAALESADRTGTYAALWSEAPLLTELLDIRRIREHLDMSPDCRRAIRRFQDFWPEAGRPARIAGLTRREARVLDALREGASNKQIAKTLGLSESTVKFHLINLYRKLGVDSRRAAVAAGCGDIEKT